MKKYHVAAGDGKGYYGVGYESYFEATELLKISQRHDPQAHIVEEEYCFTNADRIRAMSDDDLAEFLCQVKGCYQENCPGAKLCEFQGGKANGLKKWLKQPAEGGTQ